MKTLDIAFVRLSENSRVVSLLVFLGFFALLVAVFGFASPWPHWLVSFFVAALAIASSSLWRYRTTDRPRAVLVVAFPIVFASLSLAVYMCLTLTFVRDAPSHAYRTVTGFVVRPEITALVASVPELSMEDLLASTGFDATRIWETWTIRLVEWCLVLSWTALWGGVGMLVVHYCRSAGRPKITSDQPA